MSINIDLLKPEDMVELNRLHDKFFGHQFDRTDFTQGFLGAFVIRDSDGKIVMGGGVRPIAETIIVTDKEANPHVLGDALLEALRFSTFTCKVHDIEFLHAFVKDEAYAKHLLKHGFQPRARALYYGV